MDDKTLLRQIASQLEKWAHESLTGGWSTHQVQPQKDLANKIYAHLGRETNKGYSVNYNK